MNAVPVRAVGGALWRIGRFRPDGAPRLTLASLLLFTGYLTLVTGVLAGLVASAAYNDRYEIARSRTPVFVDDGQAALWWVGLPSHVGELLVEVIALHPADDGDPPLPPGLDRLPGSGEAFVSPELARVLDDRGVPDRYGEVVGTIGRSGIATQTERIAYVGLPAPGTTPGPPHQERYAWAAVSGFGVPETERASAIGELAYDRSVGEFWALAVALLLVPGLLSIMAGARFADSAVERRQLLLARLGAPRWRRAVVALPRVAPPALWSAASLLVVWAVVASVDLVVPVKGNVVDAPILRSMTDVALTVIVVLHAAAVCMAAWRTARLRSDVAAPRLTGGRQRRPARATLVLLLVLAVQPWALVLLDGAVLRALISLAAAILVIWALPTTIQATLDWMATHRARRHLAAADVGGFIGWRAVGHEGQQFHRLASGITAVVVLVAHLAAVLTLFTGPGLDARRWAAEHGTALLFAEVPLGLEAAEPLLDSWGLTAVVLLPDLTDEEQLVLEVSGSCPALRVFQLPCREGVAAIEEVGGTTSAALAAAADALRISVVDQPSGVPWERVMLTRGDGGQTDIVALARDGHLAGSLEDVDVPGGGWLRGDVERLHKSYWLSVFGIPGVAVVLLVVALAWTGLVAAAVRATARNPYLAGAPRVFHDILWVRVGVPVLVIGLASVAVAAWLLAPHQAIRSAEVPVAFLASTAVLSVTAAASGARLASRLAIREAATAPAADRTVDRLA